MIISVHYKPYSLYGKYIVGIELIYLKDLKVLKAVIFDSFMIAFKIYIANMEIQDITVAIISDKKKSDKKNFS